MQSHGDAYPVLFWCFLQTLIYGYHFGNGFKYPSSCFRFLLTPCILRLFVCLFVCLFFSNSDTLFLIFATMLIIVKHIRLQKRHHFDIKISSQQGTVATTLKNSAYQHKMTWGGEQPKTEILTKLGNWSDLTLPQQLDKLLPFRR